MIAVDTNVVVRFLTRDDEPQFRKALRVFDEESVFIADTVILETEWVLRYAYEFKPDEILGGFTRLFGLPNVQCAHPVHLRNAFTGYETGMDFGDALHLSLSHHCDIFLSFDKALVKKAKSLGFRPVRIP